jgi:hypothetical protein
MSLVVAQIARLVQQLLQFAGRAAEAETWSFHGLLDCILQHFQLRITATAEPHLHWQSAIVSAGEMRHSAMQ